MVPPQAKTDTQRSITGTTVSRPMPSAMESGNISPIESNDQAALARAPLEGTGDLLITAEVQGRVRFLRPGSEHGPGVRVTIEDLFEADGARLLRAAPRAGSTCLGSLGDMLSRALTGFGYRVLKSRNLEKAERILEDDAQRPVNLIVLKTLTPAIGGEFMGRIR